MVPTPRATRVRVSPPHGTRARYVHRSLACNCSECRHANTAYQTAYRARVAAGGVPWSPRTWEQLTLPVSSSSA